MTDQPNPSASRRKRARRAIVARAVVASLSAIIYFLRNEGLTPLCRARTGQEAQSLIDRGVRIDARTRQGCTALHFAAGRGLSDVVQVLLERGAVPNVASDAKQTPLHWVTKWAWDPDDGEHAILDQRDPVKQAESARLLLRHGADPNAKDFRGRTPLFDAAFDGNVALVKMLLQNGASAAVSDDDGHTPLHHTRDAQVARLLLAHGADVNARDKWENRTPLRYANGRNFKEVAEVLKEHGGTQ